MINTLALAVAIVIAGFLIGGRYGGVAVSEAGASGYVVVYDRFFGSARRCAASVCVPIREETPAGRAGQQ
jgi:hypothetical protein